jgi:hypothetical protein
MATEKEKKTPEGYWEKPVAEEEAYPPALTRPYEEARAKEDDEK